MVQFSGERSRFLADTAFSIYQMEGETLGAAKYDAQHKLLIAGYPTSLFHLGVYNQQLAERCKHNFFTLEILANMGLLKLDKIDAYLSGLYDKAHLKRMQFSYLRSKLVPLERHEIEALVIVNPYTRGLKWLMLAFIETDAIKADELYQKAVSHLVHIKYYYVEALYFYARFLHQHNLEGFNTIYSKGFELAQQHFYCFLQYRFEQLLIPTDKAYAVHDYSLPDNLDFTDYIQLLIKDQKHRKENK